MARRSSVVLGCLAAVTLAGGCTTVVGGVASMPPTEGPYLDGIDVDELLLTTAELRDLTGSGLDLSGIPGMDSIQMVDNVFLVDSAPPECRFVYLESLTFGPDVKQFHKTSFQTPPKSALLSEAAAAYVDADTARRAFDNVTELVKVCGDSSSGYAYVYEWSEDERTVRAESIGDCGRIYRLEQTVLIEVTYCGYSHVVPEPVVTRIASRVGAR
jgi:PknH-like extracellular domain